MHHAVEGLHEKHGLVFSIDGWLSQENQLLFLLGLWAPLGFENAGVRGVEACTMLACAFEMENCEHIRLVQAGPGIPGQRRGHLGVC